MAPAIAPRFVLVRPSNALNIGSAARAMMNFGLGDLAVVEPYAPRWRQAHSVMYGSALLDRARVVSLDEATADCAVVLGTASAHNRALRRTVVSLPALSGWLRRRLRRGGRVGVLFGGERSGLDNEALDRCHAVVRIPTQASAPSMNLGQAVAVLAYEFGRAGLDASVVEPDERLLEGRQVEVLTDAAMRAMDAAGVNRQMTPAVRRATFRRGLLRWKMTRADASWLQGLLDRLTGPA